MRLLALCLIVLCYGCSRQSPPPPQAVATEAAGQDKTESTEGNVAVIFDAAEYLGVSAESAHGYIKITYDAQGKIAKKEANFESFVRADGDREAAHEAARKRCPAYPQFDMGDPDTDRIVTFTKYESFLQSKKCIGCHRQASDENIHIGYDVRDKIDKAKGDPSSGLINKIKFTNYEEFGRSNGDRNTPPAESDK